MSSDEMKTGSGRQQHPDAFSVCGPRNVHPLKWKDLITRKDGNYKRSAIACFIQSVYLLELDRQENRTDETALAPKWWAPFKYKLVETLTDNRDGSIFGAVLEWDRAAALSGFILSRPNGAPRALLALRGTLLKSPTIRRDIEDDLRFLALETLKGSVRFNRVLEALNSISDKFGSNNVCIAGHSLGAGFALQVWKELAERGVYVESHLFNPPSVTLRTAWEWVRSMVPYWGSTSVEERAKSMGSTKCIVIPHLYINDSDYVCCYYTDRPSGVENTRGVAKLLVYAKGNKNKQRFVEAHGLEQWWSDELELRMALDNSKLISRQLKSLYSRPTSRE